MNTAHQSVTRPGMTVDWTRWMEEGERLLAQYKAIVAHEINMAKQNRWQRLDDAIYGRRR